MTTEKSDPGDTPAVSRDETEGSLERDEGVVQLGSIALMIGGHFRDGVWFLEHPKAPAPIPCESIAHMVEKYLKITEYFGAAPVVPVDGEIERLVDELTRNAFCEPEPDNCLDFDAEHKAWEVRFAAARSSLIKYVSDRMLTPEEARSVLSEDSADPNYSGAAHSKAYAKLRLRSNDAR